MGSAQLTRAGRAAASQGGVAFWAHVGGFVVGRRLGAAPSARARRPAARLPDLVKARGGTVLAWSLYELGATSFAMNLLSLHLPLDIAGRVPRGSEKFSLAFGLSMAVVAARGAVPRASRGPRGQAAFPRPVRPRRRRLHGARRGAGARAARPRLLRAREHRVPVRVRLLQRASAGRVRRDELRARVGLRRRRGIHRVASRDVPRPAIRVRKHSRRRCHTFFFR